MLPIITSLFSLCLYNCMDKIKISNFKVIHRLTLNCKKEVKSTQKQPSWCGLKRLGEKVGKSKVAAKNGCNDVNANNNCCGIIVKIY